MEKKRSFGIFRYAAARLREPGFIIISALYAAFCLFSAVWCAVGGEVGDALFSAAFILFVPAIPVAEYLFRIRFGALITVLALLIAVGSILGSPFSMYSIVPFFDDILHTISGFVFAAVGAGLAFFFFGRGERGRGFAGVMMLGFFFSLGVAVLWELWEFGGMLFLGMETADDTIVTSFTSFIFGGRADPTVFEGITETVIHYGNESFTVEGGYLDIGYIDTVSDMIVCTAGALLFLLLAIPAHLKLPALERALIPRPTEAGYGDDGSAGDGGSAASESADIEAEENSGEIPDAAHRKSDEEMSTL